MFPPAPRPRADDEPTDRIPRIEQDVRDTGPRFAGPPRHPEPAGHAEPPRPDSVRYPPLEREFDGRDLRDRDFAGEDFEDGDYDDEGYERRDYAGSDYDDEYDDDEYEDGYDEDAEPDEEPSPAREWLVVVTQLGIGALGGAALWLGFQWLWRFMPVAAFAVALAVITVLVWVVRRIRRADDLQTTVVTVLVGLFVTVSPAALLLLDR